MLDTGSDFERAMHKAKLQTILSTLQWEKPELLSFYEVTDLIKPTKQSYLGMKTIPIKDIIGSEGRHRDFSAKFYPKRQELSARWQRIDRANKSNVILPSISVYKLGDKYFVRDGNHRVSVAKSLGIEFVDAEVVELDSEIKLESGMTIQKIKHEVVEYERKRFLENYHPEAFLDMDRIVFTSPGSYPELVNHIKVHKYYINQDKDYEISFESAAKSWQKNVYLPIVNYVRSSRLLQSYPGNTEADAYLWIVRHWDNMKHEQKENNISIKTASEDYKEKFSKGFLKRWFKSIKTKLSRK